MLLEDGGGSATALEIDPWLVEAGRQLTGNRAQRFVVVDVTQPLPAGTLESVQHGLALHACGTLHHHFLHQGTRNGLHRLSLAPCCFHLTPQEIYRPASSAGRQRDLQLSRDELRNAVRMPATGSARELQRRRQMQSWRLGYDRLRRHLTGDEHYRPLRSLPETLLRTGFPEFCATAARWHQWVLPAGLDYLHWEQEGERQLAQVERLDLVRHVFRRALETWLVLDLALFLEEQGYTTTVQVFCPVSLTPRNFLIDARRGDARRGDARRGDARREA